MASERGTLGDLLEDADRWELEPSELKALLAERHEAPFWLIDCRESDEHAEVSIGGDVLMPLSEFPSQVALHLNDQPAETPLMVYCHLGMRSLQAVQFLRAKGFEKAYSLRGGIDAWSAEERATQD